MEEENRNIMLTAGEVSNLWSSFMNDTMAICGLKHFLTHIKDTQIRNVLEQALKLSEAHVKFVKDTFAQENYPLPKGFSDEDVNVHAPALFSDTFILLYIVNMGKFGISAYSIALSTSTRADIREFYTKCLASASLLYNNATSAGLEKGLILRPPHIPVPQQTEYVTDKNFLGNFLNIGRERPLLGVEINHLCYNISRNVIGKTLIMGFSQVAQNIDLRNFFEIGRDISQKQIDVFSEKLSNEYLPIPVTTDSELSTSTTPPFSDKLMVYHVTALIASAIGQYGISMATSPRADLATMYIRLLAEVGKYASDGAVLMIKEGWMEKPPQSADHEALAKV